MLTLTHLSTVDRNNMLSESNFQEWFTVFFGVFVCFVWSIKTSRDVSKKKNCTLMALNDAQWSTMYQ